MSDTGPAEGEVDVHVVTLYAKLTEFECLVVERVLRGLSKEFGSLEEDFRLNVSYYGTFPKKG